MDSCKGYVSLNFLLERLNAWVLNKTEVKLKVVILGTSIKPSRFHIPSQPPFTVSFSLPCFNVTVILTMEFLTNLQNGLDDLKPSLFGSPVCTSYSIMRLLISPRNPIRTTTLCTAPSISTLRPCCSHASPSTLPPPRPQLF